MNVNEQIEIIKRGTAEIVSEDELAKKLNAKKSLNVKAGFDPTAPDIHLGHLVLLRKLRQMQDLGHTVYFLIGDFTARIGDPTGRDQLRPLLTEKDINENAKTYKKQVFKILDEEKTKVVFNSEWLKDLSSQKILELASASTVAQMLARADFKKRVEENNEIRILEFIYPLLQGYDSLHLKADVEFGGTDQKFNLLMGRQVQEFFEQKPQVVIMTPLLEGTDGIKKMSKSLDNYIGINEPPKEIFGKIMSVSDELMLKYYEFLTDFDLKEVKRIHPKVAKVRLAEEIVGYLYGRDRAVKEKDDFDKAFSQRQAPSEMPEYKLAQIGESLVSILVEKTKLVSSKRELQRLVEQGAVSYSTVNITIKISDVASWQPQPGIIKIGKHRFLRLT